MLIYYFSCLGQQTILDVFRIFQSRLFQLYLYTFTSLCKSNSILYPSPVRDNFNTFLAIRKRKCCTSSMSLRKSGGTIPEVGRLRKKTADREKFPFPFVSISFSLKPAYMQISLTDRQHVSMPRADDETKWQQNPRVHYKVLSISYVLL